MRCRHACLGSARNNSSLVLPQHSTHTHTYSTCKYLIPISVKQQEFKRWWFPNMDFSMSELVIMIHFLNSPNTLRTTTLICSKTSVEHVFFTGAIGTDTHISPGSTYFRHRISNSTHTSSKLVLIWLITMFFPCT